MTSVTIGVSIVTRLWFPYSWHFHPVGGNTDFLFDENIAWVWWQRCTASTVPHFAKHMPTSYEAHFCLSIFLHFGFTVLAHTDIHKGLWQDTQFILVFIVLWWTNSTTFPFTSTHVLFWTFLFIRNRFLKNFWYNCSQFWGKNITHQFLVQAFITHSFGKLLYKIKSRNRSIVWK